MVPSPGLEPGSDDYKSSALTFVLRGNGRRDWRVSRFPLPGDGAPRRTRTVDTRFRRAVLYPLSYEGIDEIISHGGYHVVENIAYDQREQHDARQREHDQQAKAAHHDYFFIIHVSPFGRKEGSPSIGMRGFLLIGGAYYHRSTLSFYH